MWMVRLESMNSKSILGIALLAVILFATATPAEAWCNSRCKQRKALARTATTTVPALVAAPVPPVTPVTPVVVAPAPVAPTPAPAPAPTPTPTSPTIVTTPSESVITAFVTAYTRFDNDPPGTADISNPIIHQQANGTGTYSDPTTLAVGFTKTSIDIPAGTRFYIPHMQRYFIVEDTCAACHPGNNGNLWVDMWIDGQATTAAKADACARAVTGTYPIIKNPKSTYPVSAGVISTATCAPVVSNVQVQ